MMQLVTSRFGFESAHTEIEFCERLRVMLAFFPTAFPARPSICPSRYPDYCAYTCPDKTFHDLIVRELEQKVESSDGWSEFFLLRHPGGSGDALIE
jgi:hypothetical protein